MNICMLKKILLSVSGLFIYNIAAASCLDSLPKGNNPTSGAAVRAALTCITNSIPTSQVPTDATWTTACQGDINAGCNASCNGATPAAIACRLLVATSGADAQLAVGMGAPVTNGVYIKRFSAQTKTDDIITLQNFTAFPIKCGLYAASGMPVHLTNYSASDSTIDTEMQPARVNPAASQSMPVTRELPSPTNRPPATNYYLLCLGFSATMIGAPNQPIPAASIVANWA